jgi:hypothetical protein
MSAEALVASVVLTAAGVDPAACVDAVRGSEILDQRLIVLESPDAADQAAALSSAAAEGFAFVWLLGAWLRPAPDALGHLLTIAELVPDAAAVAPRVELPTPADGAAARIWSDGGTRQPPGLWHHGASVARIPPRPPSEIDFAPLDCCLLRGTALLRAGPPNAQDRTGPGGAGFGARLRAAGWRQLVATSARAVLVAGPPVGPLIGPPVGPPIGPPVRPPERPR